MLGAYKGVAVSRPPSGVSDVDVERSLEALAKERATLIPVERPARLGDVATLDYEGFIEETPFEGGRGEGQIVELSEGRFVPGFAGGIVGMVPGQTKQIEVRFPDEYPSAELAGKPAQFTVTLQEVKELELPTIDDEFVKTISENQTVAQLREDLRRRLEAVAAGRGRRAVGNAIMSRLLAAHDFPLPSSLVENELSALMKRLLRHAKGKRGCSASRRPTR